MTQERNIDSNLILVGVRAREARRNMGETLDGLAARTGLSKGLLSKIENFRTIPSLPVLARIAAALGVDMGELVKGIGADSSKQYILVKAGERERVERDNAPGFIYEALTVKPSGDAVVQTFVLTVTPGAKRDMVCTDGDEFIFILDGELDFKIGAETIKMSRGDSLYFDGRLPHVPVNNTQNNASLLAVYILNG
jgi:transcriptional regulator with XRE-family HTH domain